MSDTSLLQAMLAAKTVGGGGSSFTPTTAQLAAMNSGIDSTKVAQIATNTADISYNTNTGVKNLLNNTAVSGSKNGVDYTINSDGTITTENTTNANYFFVTLGTFTFESGKTYYINGCPEGGSATGYCITNTGETFFTEIGNGVTVTGDGQTRTIMVYAEKSGTDMDGLTFKPMIREVGDSSYQPYSPTNAELYAMIKAIQAQLAET